MRSGQLGGREGFLLQPVPRLSQSERGQVTHGGGSSAIASLVFAWTGAVGVSQIKPGSFTRVVSLFATRSASSASIMAQYPSSHAIHIIHSVMAGLVPAIHALLHKIPGSRDARPGMVEYMLRSSSSPSHGRTCSGHPRLAAQDPRVSRCSPRGWWNDALRDHSTTLGTRK